MNEKELAKQYRRWHFLNFLGMIVWVMNRGIRGRGVVERIPPRVQGEPPMVELDKLVRLAAIGKNPDLILDNEQMAQVAELFQTVSAKDGAVSSEEAAMMKKYLAAYHLSGREEVDVEEFLTAFQDHHTTEAHLKETCHTLRTRLRSGAAERIVEQLFRLARLHGFDPAEQRMVEHIGEYLGLMSSEIRVAEFASRREKQA